MVGQFPDLGALAVNVVAADLAEEDLPLSEKGHHQAEWWQKQIEHIQFDKVYSSDLTRAVETAKIVTKGQAIETQTLSQLREIDLGAWDGQPMHRIQREFPDLRLLKKLE